MSSKGNIATAVRSLRRNKGRSLLTMLGIIIGIVAVVVAVSIGDGIMYQIDNQTIQLGKDLLIIRPGAPIDQGGMGDFASFGQPTSGVGSLMSSDVTVAAKTPGVHTAVPLAFISDGVYSGETNRHFNLPIVATSDQLPSILNQSIAYGSFIGSDSTSIDKAVIGSQAARTLFAENVPLGQTVTILGHQFIIVGIFDDFPTTPFAIDTNFNNAVFISYSAAQQMTNNNATLYEILARADNTQITTATINQLNQRLLAAHGGQHDFSVLPQAQTKTIAANTLSLLGMFVAGMAFIALLVGGVGIMNVMLVSVTERMQEIGIRKAVGATNRQILMQFITESMVLSITGGILGVVISLFIVAGLRVFTTLVPYVSWQAVLLAFMTSALVGTIFGSVPAFKAARKDPISALRNY